MVFELTDALRGSIVKALENQEKKFLVDAENLVLVAQGSIQQDDDRYYAIPPWNSADGFSLMEDFVGNLHSPIVYTELHDVLHSGKGVFRGFKDVLKGYPLFERRWHAYKNRALLNYVNSWYNSLREEWGLEKLDSEPEDTEDLVRDDFEFVEYNFAEDKECARALLDKAAGEFSSDFADSVTAALGQVLRNQFEYNAENQQGFVCKTFSGEFSGCVIWTPCPEKSDKAVLLTGLFVEQKYRGLGIAKELFERALSSLAAEGFQWVLIANTFIPDLMQGMLNRSGFKKIGSAYIADLFAQK